MKFKIKKTKKPLNSKQLADIIGEVYYGQQVVQDDYLKAKSNLLTKYLTEYQHIEIQNPAKNIHLRRVDLNGNVIDEYI